MKTEDRDYFMLRGRQERQAAALSRGAVRGRHEELAWLYEMRVIYIDRGLIGDDSDEPETPGPVQPLALTA
jgi:hypothetical protein